jgi:hypothetical protein
MKKLLCFLGIHAAKLTFVTYHGRVDKNRGKYFFIGTCPVCKKRIMRKA